ncbi:MAG: hypothetical protein IKP91_07200 [Bacteroidaceae bacterium]|nr:hypothetical protein [Bacteroidaceae bacterium]
MYLRKKRQFASWVLLAVYVPILLLSSLHTHEGSLSAAEENSFTCAHHHCHGHLSMTASLEHDCVLCQFLTLKMLAAVIGACVVCRHVCSIFLSYHIRDIRSKSRGIIVTRGPPSDFSL